MGTPVEPKVGGNIYGSELIDSIGCSPLQFQETFNEDVREEEVLFSSEELSMIIKI